jgi:DNA-binding transcriptional LysR family regulator
MPRPVLSELTAFIAIAEQRSFRAAARLLEVSPSALSHSMRGLEARLGVRLFNRTTRSVALTESGEQLLRRARPAMADLEDAVTEVAAGRDRPTGSIRISCAESGAQALVREVLPGFLASYPEIQVEFIVDGRMVDIVADGFDAGIRLLEAVPRDMIAVRFGPDMRMIAIATPAYVSEHGTPLVPHDLARHRCIRFRFDSGTIYRWDLEHRGKCINVDVPGPLTLGNTTLMIEAALSGIGIAWVPEDRVIEHLASGRLVQLLADWSPYFPGFCLYYPANRHPPTALRLFAQAVRDWARSRELPEALQLA